MEQWQQEEAEISFWAFMLGATSVTLFFFSIFLDAQPASWVCFTAAAMAFADGIFSFIRHVKFKGKNALLLSFAWLINGVVLIVIALDLLD